MGRLTLWICAFIITPWLIVAGFFYGLYRLTLVAPGATFAIAITLFVWAMWLLLHQSQDQEGES